MGIHNFFYLITQKLSFELHSGFGLKLLSFLTKFQISNSQLKAFADDKIDATEKLKIVLGGVENIVGKGKKCWLPAFSPFPQCFQKASFYGLLKDGIVRQKVNFCREQFYFL